jgi:hypothetical protein
MNVFQLVKSVLDEIYERIPGLKAEKDNRIKAEIESLKAAYERLGEHGVPNDYSKAVTRFAYIFKYVTSHANVVYQLLRTSPQLAVLFDRPQLSISCIGGGTGSDFLGILKYIINDTKKTPQLRVNLFDKEPAWSECWNDVDEKLRSQLRISTSFVPFDVTDPKTWANYQKFLSSDLFTMIYFMSEINSLREEAEAFFTNLFENAKPGSLILYVDNNSPKFYGWLDSLVATHKWKVLKTGEQRLGMADLSEQKKDLGEYFTTFKDPKIRANIAFRICQKQ